MNAENQTHGTEATHTSIVFRVSARGPSLYCAGTAAAKPATGSCHDRGDDDPAGTRGAARTSWMRRRRRGTVPTRSPFQKRCRARRSDTGQRRQTRTLVFSVVSRSSRAGDTGYCVWGAHGLHDDGALTIRPGARKSSRSPCVAAVTNNSTRQFYVETASSHY